jgi:hypothetical protein
MVAIPTMEEEDASDRTASLVTEQTRIGVAPFICFEKFRQLATVLLQLTDVRCDSFDLRLAEIARNGLHSR